MNPNVEDRFVHTIAHEYAHVQQVAALVENEHPTVLERALIEGAAEFAAELTSGKTGFAHFAALTKGREKEIETPFAADVDQTDLSRWVDNSTMEKGNDLGYWVGYRIVKATTGAPPTSSRHSARSWNCPIRKPSSRRSAGVRGWSSKLPGWVRSLSFWELRVDFCRGAPILGSIDPK
jgi:hypothetical protein